jgi:hypothetical protein
MPRSSLSRILAVPALLALTSWSCATPLQLLSNLSGSDSSPPVAEPTTSAAGIGQSDSSEGEGAMANFRCPNSPEAYELWFDHSVKFDTPAFGSWDVDTSGSIVLSVAEGLSENSVHMPFQPGEVIVPGTVNANFGRGDQSCSFGGDMEVIVNIDGFCDQGVIHLNIIENWGDVDTTMTCCSAGSDCDTFPFQWMLPVVEYGDVTFSQANSFQVTKPFAGGDGQLRWTLMPPVQPVPLTE